MKRDTMFNQYISAGHPGEAVTMARDLIARLCPDYLIDFDDYFSGYNGYFCLSYVMRREVFERFMAWVFSVVDGFGGVDYWRRFDALPDKRVAALLMERLFNVWLLHQKRVCRLKVLERNGVLLDWAKNLTFLCRMRNWIRWVIGSVKVLLS